MGKTSSSSCEALDQEEKTKHCEFQEIVHRGYLVDKKGEPGTEKKNGRRHKIAENETASGSGKRNG